jgi:hypothetical protein
MNAIRLSQRGSISSIVSRSVSIGDETMRTKEWFGYLCGCLLLHLYIESAN